MVTMVRDGKKVTPTCPSCGCRLKTFSWSDNYFRHFPDGGEQFKLHPDDENGHMVFKDAKGHACPKVLADMSIIDNKIHENVSTNSNIAIWKPL